MEKVKTKEYIEKLEKELDDMFKSKMTTNSLGIIDNITKGILNLMKIQEEHEEKSYEHENHYSDKPFVEEMKPMYIADEAESHEFTEQDAYNWVNGMVNSDGTKGQHWNIEQTTSVAEQVGVEFEHISKYCWYATLNMIYSDYCETAKKFGVNNVDFYTDMAKDFLFDADSVSPNEKLYYYYKYIVKH